MNASASKRGAPISWKGSVEPRPSDTLVPSGRLRSDAVCAHTQKHQIHNVHTDIDTHKGHAADGIVQRTTPPRHTHDTRHTTHDTHTTHHTTHTNLDRTDRDV